MLLEPLGLIPKIGTLSMMIDFDNKNIILLSNGLIVGFDDW